MVALHRKIGLHLIIYLDDMFFNHTNREQLEVMAPMIVNPFEALGFMVNKVKSLLTPTQLIEFLGFLIDFNLSVSLSLEKGKKVQQDTSNIRPCQQKKW